MSLPPPQASRRLKERNPLFFSSSFRRSDRDGLTASGFFVLFLAVRKEGYKNTLRNTVNQSETESQGLA